MITFNDFIIIVVLGLIICYILNSKEHMQYEDPILIRIKADLLKVHPRAGELTYSISNKSYTQNKQHMHLCVKDENGEYYPYSMLIYVALHELAHAVSKTIDDAHTGKEFNENFKDILLNAEELKVYDPSIPLLTNYCGVSQ